MSMISTQQVGHIQTLTINRPHKRNALTTDMYLDLVSILRHGAQDPSVHVLVLRGQDDCFTAGNDLQDFLKHPPQGPDAPVIQFLYEFCQFPKPIIAAVNGAAVGVGSTLLLHCDYVICGQSAYFQFPFVKLGLIPEFASTFLLPRLVGHGLASRWLMTTEKISSKQAVEAQLVQEVTNDSRVYIQAMDLAQQIAQQDPEVVQQTKALLRQSQRQQVLTTIDQEAQLFAQQLQSDSFQARAQAFLGQ